MHSINSPSANGQQDIKYPLESLSHADKILYVFFREFESSLELITLRHTEIVQKLKQFATDSTYSQFSTSSRTYYKKYGQLLKSDYLNKTQEVLGNRYHAYVVTPSGISYIKQKINLLLHPPPPPVVDLKSETPVISPQHIIDATKVVSPTSPHHSPVSTSKKRPAMAQKITKQQKLDQIISQQQIQYQQTPHSALEVAEIAADSSVQSATTIKDLLGKISELNTINQQIRTSVSSLPDGMHTGRSTIINQLDTNDSDGSSPPQATQQDLDDELDAQTLSDNADFDYHFEGTKHTPTLTEEMTGPEIPLIDSYPEPIFPSITKKKLSSPPLPPKTPKERLQATKSRGLLQLILSDISEEHEQMVWDVVQKERRFTPEEKLEWFSQLLNQRGFSADNIGILIQHLRLTAQDMANAIDYFSALEIPFTSVILIVDRLITEIFDQTINTKFDWNNRIKIYDQFIGKIKLVHYFLGYFFQKNYYERALSIIQNLQSIKGKLTDAALLIYAQILLNLRSYDRLEKLIKQEDILGDLSKSQSQRSNQSEMDFVAFRVYYEQRKFDVILRNPSFSEKWKILAQFEKDRIVQLDHLPSLARLKAMYMRLIPQHPEFYAESMKIPQMIDYYLDQIRQKSRPFLQFAPLFTNWLHVFHKTTGFPDNSLPILREWLSHDDPVYEYITLQEEIISDLRDWDVHPEEWIQRLDLIRDFRDDRRPILEEFDLS